VATERQIKANRRNALKSTGPKSGSGKKRSCQNAYRHGLSIPISVRSEAKHKHLSRQFAGDATDKEILELAEQAADAQLDLERVRKAQDGLIGGAQKLSAVGGESHHPTLDERRHRTPLRRSGEQLPEGKLSRSELRIPSAPLPTNRELEEQRFFAAVEDALPELVKTCRYEKRAAGGRNRAIQKIVSIKIAIARSSRKRRRNDEEKIALEAKSKSLHRSGDPVCTENLIRVDEAMESPKLAE